MALACYAALAELFFVAASGSALNALVGLLAAIGCIAVVTDAGSIQRTLPGFGGLRLRTAAWGAILFLVGSLEFLVALARLPHR